MDHSTPGLPVHHQLLEFTQTHVHRVGDATQHLILCRPLLLPPSILKCCLLTCIQISQEAAQVVWYSHLFHNCPQFIVIHIVKGFGIVNKAEIDVFLELSCFFNDPLVPLPFLKPA